MRKALLFLIITISYLNAAAAGPQDAFIGAWEGKRAEEQKGLRQKVFLTVRQSNGQISGTFEIRASIQDSHGKWLALPGDSFGGPMLSPKVEGQVLSFEIEIKLHSGETKRLNYTMTLEAKDRALLDRPGDAFGTLAASMVRTRR